MNTDDLLILSILTGAGHSLTEAYQWLDAMAERLTFHAELDQWESIAELEAFVLAFVADYSEP